MRSLLLLRHGQTDHNLAHRAQGHLDVPLNARGREQAVRIAEHIAALRPAFVVSSDLSRARETAAAVGRAAGVEVTLDSRLREYSVGANREGKTWAEYSQSHPDEVALHRAGRSAQVPGCETPDMVLRRWLPALGDVAGRVGAGELGVIVAHGAVLRTAVPTFVGLAGAEASLGALDNCGYALLDESSSGFLPTDSVSGWRLRAWNRVAGS